MDIFKLKTLTISKYLIILKVYFCYFYLCFKSFFQLGQPCVKTLPQFFCLFPGNLWSRYRFQRAGSIFEYSKSSYLGTRICRFAGHYGSAELGSVWAPCRVGGRFWTLRTEWCLFFDLSGFLLCQGHDSYPVLLDLKTSSGLLTETRCYAQSNLFKELRKTCISDHLNALVKHTPKLFSQF